MADIGNLVGGAIFGVGDVQGQSPIILIALVIIVIAFWIFISRNRKKMHQEGLQSAEKHDRQVHHRHIRGK